MAFSPVAHLLRRAGFGPSPGQLAQLGNDYASVLTNLLNLNGPDPSAEAIAVPTLTLPSQALGLDSPSQRDALGRELTRQLRELQVWWLGRMAAADLPLAEKLTLFWHGHFATAINMVRFPSLMYRQNQLFRTLGATDFRSLTQAVAKDPAMLLWLNADTDKKAHPNENFSRELMELFTLGIGNYTETDVRQGARGFTGWIFDPRNDSWGFQPDQHDYGIKTFLDETGNFGGEEIIDIILAKPESARFVLAGMWSHFAYPITPADPVVDDLLASYGSQFSILPVMRAIFEHPQFSSPTAIGGLVKQPIEFVVGAYRALGLTPDPTAVRYVTELGQEPFNPPNVGGWPQNEYWLSTAASFIRLRLATELVRRREVDLSPLEEASVQDRPAAAAALLGVDDWSPSSARALADVARSPSDLLALAIASPEYAMN